MGKFLNRGNEEFADVVNSEIYVDKTDMIAFFNEVINTEQRYICVSRPRRFGKSITANMIAAYFEKNCDSSHLFAHRKLGQIIGWDKNLNQYDVIRIDVSDIRARTGSAEEALYYIERETVKDLITAYPDCSVSVQDRLASALDLVNMHTGYRFVIIIDEWDCLFREDKNNIAVQEQYIDLLRSLFKGNSSKKFLALAYITGILPIKKYNSESALNNFREYTMVQPFRLAQYIGFTEEEVQALCREYHADYEELRSWYDGYAFAGTTHIYGPNSVVTALSEKFLMNYWSQTVAYHSLASYITMNFDGLKDAVRVMLGGQRIHVKVRSYENDMTSFKSKDDVLTMLIHLGYLAYDFDTQEAYIPNKEVRMCFEDTLEAAGWNEIIETIEASEALLEATLDGDTDEVALQLEDCHRRNTSILNYNNENALASCIALAYYTARKDYTIIRELPAGRGFADLVFIPKIGIDKPAMIIELKWNQKAVTAIDQIRKKQYLKALEYYRGEILLVGISYKKSGKEGKMHLCKIERVWQERSEA